MRSICFYFQVHQPFRLRKYRFFEIGADHYYYDDYHNNYIMNRVAKKCYLPTNRLLLQLIKEYGCRFKVSFSISGVALEQFELYAPEVLDSFRELAQTGCVEFLAETYSHSLSSLKSITEFECQVKLHGDKIRQLLGVEPVTFRNTELIYSDEIGRMVSDMGYKLQLTEGAKHVLGWKSPNYMYCNALDPKLKLLLKNYQLSDDIAFRFSQQSWAEWPLTTEKFVDWLNMLDHTHQVVNLFMDYETFGEHQWEDTGIFNFMKALPYQVLRHSNYQFKTPADLIKELQPVSAVHVPYPISWADEERDLTAWLGNELQDEAFNNLYALEEKIKRISDENILRDWNRLQTSDHFYYMCTKWFSDGDVHKYFNHYDSPYEAFINYMNVLSDFILRVDQAIIHNPLPMERVGEGIVYKQEPKVKAELKKIEDITKRTRKIKLKDIQDFSDYKIKKILKELDMDTLSIALKGMSKDLKERFTDNLGKQARGILIDKMKKKVNIPRTEILDKRGIVEELMEKHKTV